ncbi:dihydrolipoamide acetyltransferase family protein [Arthrobacter sp. GMC3]|uniref:dihydrolipoamide acetyltransferase family protein n=1 Tax=Arthrobacter sp. GMC3 TaxID=2058894 RepID=UPI000CE3AEE7|nr:dihydrolipoamide acetyltransferase family protein [Arthrobacter sp. GMC3]
MIEIQMPRLSDTMEEGVINAWLKKPGELVNIGDILVEIETDKAVMEHEAYEAGTLHSVLIPEGERARIGAVIAVLDDGKRETTPPAAKTQKEAPAPNPELNHPRASIARTFSSPLARKDAKERGVALERLTGSGPGGRIVRSDVQAAAQRSDNESNPAGGNVEGESNTVLNGLKGSLAVPFTSTRKVISSRLSDSSHSIPHFSLTAVADVEELVQLREEINTQRQALGLPKVSMNDFIVRASALALVGHPGINASYSPEDGGQKLLHSRINIGVAMAAEAGLVVPVLLDAALKPVSQLGKEAKALAAAARDRKLQSAQMSGGTFTVSNLGMYGVESFTAIINAPEGAILAVGQSAREPVVMDGGMVPRHRMRLTLSADHRIIDGADGAAFLQTLVGLLAQPLAILA